MVEEKNGTSNGGEMPPQEDSQKLPLTTDGSVDTAPKAEIKPNDAAVDIGPNEEEEDFKGLTKEELMKYSKDPFWRKFRIFLMFLFWAGWLAMLVLAILIIVQAPQCEPLPSLQWLQESPLLQVDINSNKISTITTLMSSLGLTSFYIPSLISFRDYYQMDMENGNVKETVLSALENLSSLKMKGVTDYVPSPVHLNHPWATNSSYDQLLEDNLYLNYSSTILPDELQKVFEFWKSEYNVTGFLVPDAEVKNNPDMVNMTVDLNVAMEPNEIVVGMSTMNLDGVVNSLDRPGTFKEFVMNNYEDWHYYQFNPLGEEFKPNTPDRMACFTLAMMLIPGTPLMKVGDISAFEETYSNLITSNMEFREKDSIKFGETQFANTTSNVVAFTRTMKGTPGYAVVINLGDGSINGTETVDFSVLDHVPTKGTLAYSLNKEDNLGSKSDLDKVVVGNLDGLVIQFIAEDY